MRVFSKAPDGGPDSPVTAYFLFEIKPFCSIALLRFNKGGREAYHSHAFNALTWFISGSLEEQVLCSENDGYTTMYSHSILPKITRRNHVHRVVAGRTSWCFTIRGPWVDKWTEVINGKLVTLTHGRKEL